MNLNQTDAIAIKAIHYGTEQPVELTVSQGVIVRMEPLGMTEESLPWIAPGLVDLQINGYQGMDFNTLPIADGTLESCTRSLWVQGVCAFMPTVITNGGRAIEEAMSAIAKACLNDPQTNRAVIGIHLEGPFISPEDGPRGAHDRRYVQKPDWELFQRWQEAANGKIKIITLSPEWPDSARFIEKCTASGVIVSIGHTSATTAQIRNAVAAGATMSTHLGNGAHLTLPRHPNYLWDQLAEDRLWACIIADGFHLPESVLRVIRKVKGERTLLVSDAVQLAGKPAGAYDLHIGGKVVLTPEGRLHLADNPGLLAGSAQMQLAGIEHLTRSAICTIQEAWDMASIRPQAFIEGREPSPFAVGAAADFVLFQRHGHRIDVQETFVQGQSVYKAH